MMLRKEKGGRTVCSEVRERGKKRKSSWEGRDSEDTATAYRCWSLQQRSVALSGHRKMVSVRGELTVAYNLMFSILDSFSMGNATARNSIAQIPFLLLSLSDCHCTQILITLTVLCRTLTPKRALSLGNQGLASTGLALRAGPCLPLHQGLATALMQIDRAVHPLPFHLKCQRARKPSREARGKEGVEAVDEHCYDSVLESRLSDFFLFCCSLVFIQKNIAIKRASVTIYFISFLFLSGFTGVAPAKKSPKLVSSLFFYIFIFFEASLSLSTLQLRGVCVCFLLPYLIFIFSCVCWKLC